MGASFRVAIAALRWTNATTGCHGTTGATARAEHNADRALRLFL